MRLSLARIVSEGRSMRSISRNVAKLNTFDVKNLLYHKEVARNFAKRPEVIEKQHEFPTEEFPATEI